MKNAEFAGNIAKNNVSTLHLDSDIQSSIHAVFPVL